MAAVSKGAIVSFQRVDNFDELTLEDASDIIYNQLIPACEAKGVKLSRYGNHAGQSNLDSVVTR